MAEINDLILPIGADPKDFKKAINQVKDAIKDLQNKINSTEFNLVDAQDINNLNELKRTLATLQDEVNKTKFDSFTDSSKTARTAATSLNLVVQDLPFGFIAIQNNLPALFTSFNKLREDTKSTTGAFAALYEQLKGPAGIFFAYTAVTTVITTLVQKYGSLGEAFDAIFTKTNNAAQAQKLYNEQLKEGIKTLGSEVNQIDLITKGIQNEKLSREQRLNYFYQAKKEIPELLAGLNEENILTKNGIKILNENANARKKFLDIQGKQQATNAVLNENYTDEFEIQKKLVTLYQKRDEIEARLGKTRERLNKVTDSSIRKDIENALRIEEKRLSSINVQIEDLKQEQSNLVDVQLQYNSTLENTIKVTGEYYQRNERLNQSLKDSTNSQDEARKSAKKLAEARAEQFRFAGDIRSLRNEKFLTEPILELPKKIDPKKYLEPIFRGLETLPGAQIPALVELYFDEKRFKNIKDKLKDGIPEMEDFKENFIKNIIAEDLKGVDVTPELIIQRLNEQFKGLEKSIQVNEEFLNIFKLQKVLNDELNKQEKERIGNINSLAREFRFLQEPLADLIGTSLDGAGANWKEFADTVIQQIKRIIAALAAKALVQGLLKLLNPASSVLNTLSPEQVVGLNQFSTAFFTPGFSLGGAANFSGIQPAGLQMGGQVNLTLRGNDLVGAINRTNTNINRVG
jgi:hypothetical protein